ncbi:MAG TPA: hypothetical protein VN838_13535 [Bradyrhizobium sp.]|nr:hypothetical protein [Bradyrhizobium sp.]
MLDKLVEGRKPTFEFDKLEVFAVGLNTNDGFKYGVEPSKASVAFNHRMRPKAVSGGPPVMEMLSQPQPFTSLLPVVSQKLIETMLLLPGPKGRTFNRYGIVSTTPVDADEMPPGVKKMIEYFGRPWGKLAGGFSIQVTADVGKGNNYSDRCVHTVARAENTDDLMTIMFDYQRVFTSGQPITMSNLKEVTSSTERAALKYFEELAEGHRFDEIEISEPANA